MGTETILLIAETAEKRIDTYLAANTELSRSKIKKLITDGAVERNGKPCKANAEVRPGDAIRLRVPEENGDALPEPEDIPLDVVYEDDELALTFEHGRRDPSRHRASDRPADKRTARRCEKRRRA